MQLVVCNYNKLVACVVDKLHVTCNVQLSQMNRPISCKFTSYAGTRLVLNARYISIQFKMKHIPFNHSGHA